VSASVAGGLSWRELEPFGVEIGADLARPVSAEQQAQFLQLFREHGLLVAKQQRLSMQRQREICGWLGPVLLREGESGLLSNQGDHDVVRSGLSFHADAAYTEHPFEAIALHALDVVDGASSTRFAHAERALRALPVELLAQLTGREVELITPAFDLLATRVCDIESPQYMQRAVRPTTLLNPASGRVYLNLSEMHAARLPDFSWVRSRAILNRVFDVLYAAGNVAEHRWSRGDLVIWDNRALQHARGDLSSVGKRVLQRVIVGTEGVAPHTL